MKVSAMTRWVILAFIVPSALFGIASGHKTAYVQEKGHFFIKGTYWNYSSGHFWNASGKRKSAFNDFDKDAYHLRLEYGLTCTDTLSVNGGWARVDESINGRTFGFEDVEIAWKHNFGTKWCHHISSELVGIFPTETQYKPGIRYGQYGGELNLLASRGFTLWNCCGSYDVRVGYRGYEGFPSDQLRSDLIVQWNPFTRLTIRGSGHLEYGFFNGSSRSDESLFLLNPNYRLFRSQVELTYCFWRGMSGFIGYHRHLWGRNVGTGGGIYGGAQVQF